MGKVSKKANKSVYQLAREELHLSREKATSENDRQMMVGIDADRLEKLEKGRANIYPEDVVEMAKRYNKPELRNYYCCNECAIGKLDANRVVANDSVYEILVKMAVSLENANEAKKRLMEILVDGKVDNDEKNDYKKISEELELVSDAIESLQLWCEKMKIDSKM